MNDASQITLTIVAVVVVLGALFKLSKSRQAKRESDLKEYSARFNQRQVQPDFAAFRSRFGCDVPLVLHSLQSDPVRMREGDFDVHLPSSPDPHYVAWFEPMDDEHMSFVWPGTEGFYPFANDGCGNAYLVNPRDADSEVSFYDHETGEREPLAVRLSEFLSAKRTTDESDRNG